MNDCHDANMHTRKMSLSDDMHMMSCDDDGGDDDIDSVPDVDMCNNAIGDDAKKKRKRVRITPEPQVLCYIETLEDITDDHRNELWWQKSEYEGTKDQARNLCREIRRMGDSGGGLGDAIDRASMMAASGLELDVIHKNEVLTPNKGLVKWCHATEGRRGLERWSCKIHGLVRSKLVGEVKHAVMLEQARQFLSNQRNCETLAAIAEAASRKSRAFAALLGQADALAIEDEQTTQIPRLPASPSGLPLQKSFQSRPQLSTDPESDPMEEDEEETSTPIFLLDVRK